jgi:hypothetical protein
MYPPGYIWQINVNLPLPPTQNHGLQIKERLVKDKKEDTYGSLKK